MNLQYTRSRFAWYAIYLKGTFLRHKPYILFALYALLLIALFIAALYFLHADPDPSQWVLPESAWASA